MLWVVCLKQSHSNIATRWPGGSPSNSFLVRINESLAPNPLIVLLHLSISLLMFMVVNRSQKRMPYFPAAMTLYINISVQKKRNLAIFCGCEYTVSYSLLVMKWHNPVCPFFNFFSSIKVLLYYYRVAITAMKVKEDQKFQRACTVT